MKLNSRLYKQKCIVGMAKSTITRANMIDLIELVADTDEEAVGLRRASCLYVGAMPDVSLDNDGGRFVILVVAANSCVVRGLSRDQGEGKESERTTESMDKGGDFVIVLESSTIDLNTRTPRG